MPPSVPSPSLRSRLPLALGLALAVAACGTLRPPGATSRDGRGPQAAEWNNSGPGSALFGVCPNFSQVGNGRFLAVVSRDFGRLSRTGAVIAWHWPSYAENRLRVAAVGLHDGRGLRWADELRLVGQDVVPDTGLIRSRFLDDRTGVRLTLEDVAARDQDALARRVTVHNGGSRPLAGAHLMTAATYALTLSGAGDRLSWAEDQGALVVANPDAGVAAAVGASEEPDGFQCGLVGAALGPAVGGFRDAADGRLSGHASAAGALGTEGALSVPLPPLAPGASASVTLYHTMGRSSEGALAALAAARAQGFEALAGADASFWRRHLARAPVPSDAREAAVFRRALIVLKQLQADTGALLAAASAISPAYHFVWIQDVAADVRALSACGYLEEARAAIDFLARVQKADGDWWVTHRADGRPFMLWEHGSEWMGGHWLSALGAYVDASQDWASVRRWWPTIELACRFMASQITPTGLIGVNMDLWETHKDQSWSYTNASFVGGLEAGARLADRIGRPAQARAWRSAAATIRQALRVQAVVAPEGYLGKGVRPGAQAPDRMIDASILGATWPFGAFAPRDPISLATTRRITERLLQPGGGVRRWETDAWYGGQGWCELTDWLALVADQQGDRALATRLHAANTARAHTTGSLQIGEVFDERTGRFTSAFPLGWPEAQYVVTSLALRGRIAPVLPPGPKATP
ncbi:MAG: glycoside hydrolase family 15 protein [Candidatus Sericytochromatia bacterium]|nr:glycoside hydrolase family 15 protein [Candidatus Sericytochromatia bacterium]